jgi:hypothetical protein
MVLYRELGDIILRHDGTPNPQAPSPRLSHEHRLAYAYAVAHDDNTFVNALSAHTYVRPVLLDLGAGRAGVGVAALDGGVFEGLPDDYIHFSELGIQKTLHQCASLFIVDSWETPADGVLATRRFELRIADVPSFHDGYFTRRSFPEGYLLNSLLTASDRADLTTLLVCGVGTDNLVIHAELKRLEFLRMVDDLIYVIHVVTALNADTATLEAMQKMNFRFAFGFV